MWSYNQFQQINNKHVVMQLSVVQQMALHHCVHLGRSDQRAHSTQRHLAGLTHTKEVFNVRIVCNV